MCALMSDDPQHAAGGRHPQHLAPADPSALTTAQIAREVKHLREYIEARLDALEQRLSAMDTATEAARATIATAVDAAADAARAAVSELDTTVQRQMNAAADLNAAQFVTYRTLLDSQAEKVALALSSADKAEEKASVYNEKRFDCVAVDTPVMGEDGPTTIGQLRAGDTIQDAGGFTHVVSTYIDTEPLFEVVTPEGTVRCTAQHPWYARQNADSAYTWVETQDLAPGWLLWRVHDDDE